MPAQRDKHFVVAAVVFERDGHVLTVRKRDTRRFMLPGGKLEPEETALDAAVREIAEELGLDISDPAPELLGEFVGETANEPGWTLESTVFRATLPAEPAASAEIAEVRWVPVSLEGEIPPLAPLLEHQVFPLLR